MKLLELELAGFGSYAEGTSLDLSEVKVCAVTGANGSGKSTLFDAMLWTMFGQVPGRTARDLICDTKKLARARIVIASGGERHEFIRERTHSQVTAQYLPAGGAEVTGARAVSEAASQLMNCNRDAFALTAFSRQGDSGRFGAMDPAERRIALAAGLLGDMFDNASEAADTDSRDQAASAAAAAEALDTAAAAAADLCDAEAGLAQTQTVAEQARAAAEQATAAAEAAAATRERLAAAEIAANRSRRAEKARSEASAKAADTADALQRLGPLVEPAEGAAAEAETAAESLEQKARRGGEAAAAAEALAAEAPQRLEMLSRSSGECWTCGAALDPQNVAEHAAHQNELIESAVSARVSHDEMADTAAAARQAATRLRRSAVSAAQRVAETQRDAQRYRRDADNAQAVVDEAATLAAELDQLRHDAAGLTSTEDARAARAGSASADQHLGAARRRAQNARDAHQRLPSLRDAAQAAKDAARGSELLRLALTPSGLPHLALESGMNTVAAAANEALARLGQQQIRFRLEAASTLSTPPVAIEARDGADAGTWRSYGTYSGGERMRMDIAFRLGLSAALGINWRTLVIDEGWGALDDAATSAVARLLISLASTGALESCYTISHIPNAVDNFEHRIEVVKDASGSRAELLAA